ncbi:MBL fold metallo-hydrolase [Sphingosinicella sp. CPCC 101087]|uniref:MBL fold metallo-hydrolase n=1 Tax=Sphingosinicella sp. CPCC 101087 TaxID=2497754 RepID=UPI00101DF312|nr:MBL fold metallo-hydrolase [Sphingosinicella sp. CPCC 101087]
MRRWAAAVMGLLTAAASGAAASPPPAPAHGWHLVPGSVEPNRGPDGNSIFLEAPEGLILVDTGRHPEHRDQLLGFARERGRPIAAIVNTHWHLDHSTGNGEIRAAFPDAPLYATRAIESALAGFLADGRRQAEAALAAGGVPPEREAEIRRFLAVMAAPDTLRPTRPVRGSAELAIAGRRLRLNVASFAVTEGDLWIFDPAAGLLIAGDLVVAEVPFMDTACPEGWRRALDEIAATPFTTLVPGHGEPMDRAAFLAWRAAFGNLLDCAASDSSRDICIAGWRSDAARFQRPGREAMIDRMTGHYIDTRLRAAPQERARYCGPPQER